MYNGEWRITMAKKCRCCAGNKYVQLPYMPNIPSQLHGICSVCHGTGLEFRMMSLAETAALLRETVPGAVENTMLHPCNCGRSGVGGLHMDYCNQF